MTEFPVPTANSFVWGITAGPRGNLWFTEQSGSRIGRITTDGVINESPRHSQAFQGITAGPDGNIWFADGGGNAIAAHHLPSAG